MFAKLLLAHLVADFVLQNNWLVRHKQRWDGLLLHTGLVLLALVGVAWNQLAHWWPWLLMLTAIHGLIDWAKVRLDRLGRLPPILTFLADQAIHVGAALAAVQMERTLAGQSLPIDQLLAVDTFPWWAGCLYLICIFAAPIALPIWLAPASLMRRPGYARWTLALAALTLLELTQQGFDLCLLPTTAWFYGLAVLCQDHFPTLRTLHFEMLGASALAIGAGWVLR
jgi:hypothetical protein